MIIISEIKYDEDKNEDEDDKTVALNNETGKDEEDNVDVGGDDDCLECEIKLVIQIGTDIVMTI